uniref:phage portal protein n=1 Tax=Escherichia coli TaxID=562 RepID=UPI002379DF86
PKRISNPNNTGDSRNCRAGVQLNDSGAALGYYVSEDGYPGWMPQKWTWIPRELPGGRASFIHVFEPVEDGQTRGANVFYSVMCNFAFFSGLIGAQFWAERAQPKSPELDAKLLVSC